MPPTYNYHKAHSFDYFCIKHQLVWVPTEQEGVWKNRWTGELFCTHKQMVFSFVHNHMYYKRWCPVCRIIPRSAKPLKHPGLLRDKLGRVRRS